LLKIKIHIFLGSAELTDSKFRTCPNPRARNRHVPIWGWVAIGIAAVVLLLIIGGIIFKFTGKSKKNSSPEQRQPEEKGNNNSLIIHNFSLF
jgi:flagellar basal body-associated protein FliL